LFTGSGGPGGGGDPGGGGGPGGGWDRGGPGGRRGGGLAGTLGRWARASDGRRRGGGWGCEGRREREGGGREGEGGGVGSPSSMGKSPARVYGRKTSLRSSMSGNANTKFVVAKRKNAHNLMAVFIYIVSTSDSGRREEYSYLYVGMINKLIMIMTAQPSGQIYCRLMSIYHSMIQISSTVFI
jgi:hypothetical protein